MSYLLDDLMEFEFEKRAQAEQEKVAGGEYDYFENLNEFKKFLKKNPEAAKRRFSPDDFEYSEDYDEARNWHYSNYKASPEERKLLAEHQRIKKQDESMAEKTQEAYRSQHEKNVKRAKRLENIGLGVGLGGAGLAALSTYSKKLPEKYRMPLGLGGIGLVAGSMIPLGKGGILENKSYEKYNQPMNDFNKRQEVRDSNVAYQKYLKNRNEHWAFETFSEFEKTAARQFKDFEDFKNSMPKDKKKAANLKFSPDDFEWGEYDAGLGYNFEDARRWHYDTYRATPKEKETINNLYRSMHEDHQNFTKQQAAAKGDYEKALSRGKTMRRAGLGVSAGGAGLALLAGSGKLPKNLKVPVAATGAVAAIGGLGVRRKGRSLTKKEREKYNRLEIDYGKRHEEKISSPAFKNYWDGVHDHWGDWGQWMGPYSNKE